MKNTPQENLVIGTIFLIVGIGAFITATIVTVSGRNFWWLIPIGLFLACMGGAGGEANKAALEARFGNGSLKDYREELIQIAAVAVAMVESYDRNKYDYPDTTIEKEK